ncbi:PREDICTED: golgin subfamily A member 6-like protein 1 [Cyphomyrmex costatus]|uniref:golgin subfamily A member 6-like protein 1 n=1 Tax=Cyphomyrmex costatus TaxID=456900 RepID=UPI000852365E|nr:PREDICTED: golgin subfamily A member 6-like protein 1 [Cyphomyrmex costatus]
MLVFERGRRRTKARIWKWKEETIEEVKEIKYLGYTLQKNGGSEKHIKERIKRATVAMKRTWSIGERIFKDNFERRIKMFNSLVESIALYGAELDWRTPNYILEEETKISNIKTKATRRAAKYEEKIKNSKKKLIQECVKELGKERREEKVNKWKEKRRELLERAGLNKVRGGGEEETGEQKIVEELMKRIEKREEEERLVKINESRSEENVIHMLKECTETKSEKQMVEFLGEEGKGIETMKKIDKARKEAEKRERRNGSEEADMLDTGSRSCSGIDS